LALALKLPALLTSLTWNRNWVDRVSPVAAAMRRPVSREMSLPLLPEP